MDYVERTEKRPPSEAGIDLHMPVTYQIDKANRIIYTRCTGAVTLQEVVDHFRALERDPDCPERLDVLLDLSDQTTVPERENLQEVTAAMYRVRRKVQFGSCAIVACSDGLFGMIRMFEVFAERYFHESCAFRSVNEAEVWLSSQHPATKAAG